MIFSHLDERLLLLGAEARALGHGGIRLVVRAAGVREATVSLGVDELDSGAEPLGRARQPGGGRKRAADLDPGLRPADGGWHRISSYVRKSAMACVAGHRSSS